MLFALPMLFALSACGGPHGERDDHHAHEEEQHAHGEEQHAHEEESHAHGEAPHADEIILTEHQLHQAGIETEKVAPAPFAGVIRVGGQLSTPIGSEQTVVANADGIVTYAGAAAVEGMAVGAGQLIATITAKQLQDGDATQKARIAYQTALKEYQRVQELAADKIVSQRELEASKAAYETAKAALGSAAASGHRVAEDAQAGMRVVAPLGGYVKNRLAQQGDYVTVGTPILTITQNRKLQLRADVPETYYARLAAVEGANFRIPADHTVYSLAQLHGRLVAKGKTRVADSYTIPVTFEFDNVGNFMPGAFAEVYLLGKLRPQVLSVPSAAITEEQGLYYIYIKVKDEHDAFMKREVRLGDDNGVRTEILQGLQAGEEVVVKGAMQVRLAAMSSAIPEGHSH